MVANFHDRTEVERFLRDADAGELLAVRGQLQDLMANIAPQAPEAFLGELAARIAYELRFRQPQAI